MTDRPRLQQTRELEGLREGPPRLRVLAELGERLRATPAPGDSDAWTPRTLVCRENHG
jgi:hypothetical protein